MFDAAERAALRSARVGRLATADAQGRPHVVPICFGLLETEERPPAIVTPIDEKPKSVEPTELRRVRDVRNNPRVAVVVDRYDEDWSRLGWVQVRGTAVVRDPHEEPHRAAVAVLREEYEQYADQAIQRRPIIDITVGSVRSWGDLSALVDRDR